MAIKDGNIRSGGYRHKKAAADRKLRDEILTRHFWPL